jgi:hypothetical protein
MAKVHIVSAAPTDVATVSAAVSRPKRKPSYVPMSAASLTPSAKPRSLLSRMNTVRTLDIVNMGNVAADLVAKARLSDGLAVRRDINLMAVLAALLGIGAAIWAENVLYWDSNVPSPMVDGLKAVSSASTALLCACVFQRRKLDLKLRAVHSLSQTERSLGRMQTMRHWHIARPLLLELLACAVHSPPWCHSLWTINAGDYENPNPARYSLDALASTWMVAVRPYLLVHFLHDQLGLNDLSAQMVAHWNNVSFDTWFTVRMVALEHALAFVFGVFATVTATMSYLLRTWERPLCAPWRAEVPWFCSNTPAAATAAAGAGNATAAVAGFAPQVVLGSGADGTVNHNFIANSAWNVIITMTTVGYGDMYPSSHGGRFIATLAALMGITLVALMVDMIHKSMEFSQAEEKAYRLVQERRAKLQLQRTACVVIQASARFYLLGPRPHEGAAVSAGLVTGHRARMRLTNFVETLREFRAQKDAIANLRGHNDTLMQSLGRNMGAMTASMEDQHAQLHRKVEALEAQAKGQAELQGKLLHHMELLQSMVQELREPLQTSSEV